MPIFAVSKLKRTIMTKNNSTVKTPAGYEILNWNDPMTANIRSQRILCSRDASVKLLRDKARSYEQRLKDFRNDDPVYAAPMFGMVSDVLGTSATAERKVNLLLDYLTGLWDSPKTFCTE